MADKPERGEDYVYLFDTTLRDGAQGQGVDFSVPDKIAIARALDEIGLDYIEGGWPGANPTDDAFFGAPPAFDRARFVAFGMTRRSGRSAENDPGLAVVVGSKVDAVCIFGKAWDFQVDVALGVPRSENIDMIADSVALAHAKRGEAMFDAEHFFDGYKANPSYALDCVKAAYDAGARWAVLCDTNGGSLPDEVERIVAEVAQSIPGSHLGIHAHNDTENAVANTLGRIARRGAPGPGHLERPGRAMRQRQYGFADPHLDAENRLRDRRRGGAVAPAHQGFTPARRTA